MPLEISNWLGSLTRTGKLLARGLLHLVYPNTCWLCGAFIDEDQIGFCSACRSSLTSDPHSACPRCSSSVGPHVSTADGCSRCRNESLAFQEALRLGPYDGLLREVVLRLKHSANEGLAEVVAGLWGQHLRSKLESISADVIIPVPLHWRKRLGRGYNQSQALARVLAGGLRIPCKPRWLKRIRYTQPQIHQTPAARRDNVRGAFRARSGLRLEGKTVLLVDDVMTTGSTASEAARALKVAGPERIVVAVLAHAV